MPAEKNPNTRNIVVCCDGTSNHFAKDRTNVAKLCQALDQDDRQLLYYHPGLGTMEPPGALTPWRRKFWRTLGFAFGFGLSSDIRDAYVFLMNHWTPGDRIFLFGFSRGAYTVRALAALIHLYGILREGNDAHVPYAIRMLGSVGARNDKEGSTRYKQVESFINLARDFKETFGRPCRIHFVGVWDTVSSVGWVSNSLNLPYTANNPSVDISRHALAIDERRSFFRQNLWSPAVPPRPSGPRDLKQVWFPGAHSDVGGGYPQRESALANVTLQWMLREANEHGLHLDQARLDKILSIESGPPIIHNELKGWWTIGEFVPKKHVEKVDLGDGKKGWVTSRRMNLFSARRIPEGASLHDSAFTLPGYKPVNLPKTYVRTA